MPLALAIVGIMLVILRFAEGRARLLEPPMRSSYWRELPTAPLNFKDDELNCGGFDVQWQQNNGRCGACGDPVGTKENEYPGKYAQFPPQRLYVSGSFINATVFSDPNMLGWFEFRLCTRQDGPNMTDLQACFQEHVLRIEETNTTRFYVGSVAGFSDMHVILPQGVICDHCLLQWKYNTGFRSSSSSGGQGQGCLGSGQQEQYINCADIRIIPTNISSSTSSPSSSSPASTTTPTLTTASPIPVLGNSTDPSSLEACTPSSDLVKCQPKDKLHKLMPGMDQWCLGNCFSGRCQGQFCSCFCDYRDFKIPIDVAVLNRVAASPSLPRDNQSSTTERKLCYMPQTSWDKTPGMPGWCQMYCPSKWCADMCQLSLC